LAAEIMPAPHPAFLIWPDKVSNSETNRLPDQNTF
jgi:hypothetical protein